MSPSFRVQLRLRSSILAAALAAQLVALAPPATAGVLGTGTCVVGPRPAATLLIPYFEVDLADPGGRTTLFSVTNLQTAFIGRTDHIVRVTLWTDFGVPTLAFDLHLKSYDIQTFNVRDLFAGHVPSTGAGVDLSAFAYCSASSPVHANPVLDASARAMLRNRHTGVADPGTGNCSGGDHDDAVARGYITIDMQDQCGPLNVGGLHTPAKSFLGRSYFTDGAMQNQLTGDFMYVDPSHDQAEGNAAVHVIADPDRFPAGPRHTFYGSLSSFDARDKRAPLADVYFTRYLNGGAFSGGTDVVVWRDPRVGSRNALSCGAAPTWFPLKTTVNARGEDPTGLQSNFTTSDAGLASQRVEMADLGLLPSSFGGAKMTFADKASKRTQALVLPVVSAAHYSIGLQATAITDLCNVTP